MPPKLPFRSQLPGAKVSDYAVPIATYSVPSHAPTSKSKGTLISRPLGVRTGLEKAILVGCEWYFTSDGVAEVKKNFHQKFKEQGLGIAPEIYWDEDTFVWVAVCITKVVEISRTLILTIQELVVKEFPEALDYDSDDEDDFGNRLELIDGDGIPYEHTSNYIIRLSVWKRKLGRSEADLERDDVAEREVEIPKSATNSHNFTDHRDATAIWDYNSSPASFAMRDIISGDVLQLIMEITGAECRADLELNKVFIRGISESQCDQAYHKFSIISKYANLQSNHCSHMFYIEGIENLEYQVKYFTSVNNHYFNNTLLDNLLLCGGCDYDNLNQALTIRLADWDSLKGVYITDRYKVAPTTPSSHVEDQSIFWAGYNFPAIGTEETNPLRLLQLRVPPPAVGCVPEATNLSRTDEQQGIQPALSAERTSAVLGWVDEIPQTKATIRRLGNIPTDHPDPVKIANQMKLGSPTPPLKEMKPAWDSYVEFDGQDPSFQAKLKAQSVGKFRQKISYDSMQQSSDTHKSVKPKLEVADSQLQQLKLESNTSPARTSASWASIASQPQAPQLTLSRSRKGVLAEIPTELIKEMAQRAPLLSTTRHAARKPSDSVSSEKSPVSAKYIAPPFAQPSALARMATYSAVARDVSNATNGSQTDSTLLLTGKGTVSPKIDVTSIWKQKDLDWLEFKPCEKKSEPLSSEESVRTPLNVKFSEGQPSEMVSLLDEDNNFGDDVFALLPPLQPVQHNSFGQGKKSESLFPTTCFATPSLPNTFMQPTCSALIPDLENTPNGIFPEILNIISSEITQNVEQDEVSTRKFHQTMCLRAPKRKNTKSFAKNQVNPFEGRLPTLSPPRPVRQTARPNLNNDDIDLLPSFILQINSELSDLIAPLRGHRGDIKVRVEFGRIILKDIPRKAIAKPGSNKSYGVEELLQILEPIDSAIETYFTSILTSVPSDIQFIMEMKNHSGQRIWNTESKYATSRVMYEFICHRQNALSYLPTSLEVNANSVGCHCRLRQKREYGQIYVHGTKRQWDLRIAADGYEMEKNIDPIYKRLGNEITDSLYVPEQQTPFLVFKIDNSVVDRDQLILDGVRVHRIVEYMSMDANSVLHITEIYDLDVNAQIGKTHTIYKAESNTTPRPGCEKVDYWHEVRISSIEADKIFEENETLEFGDEASWTPEILSTKHVAGTLCRPACEMLKQMDGIGFWNDNGIEDDKAAPPAEKKPKPVPYQFW